MEGAPEPSDNRPLRIFVSATAADLGEHRLAVRDAILKLGWMPVCMEDFGAQPLPSVEACIEGVRNCDALVAIVARRYGWVPSHEEGGDGRRSITWLEVAAARDDEIPVLAFLDDPVHAWGHAAEEARLRDAQTEEEMIAVGRCVHALAEFRADLGKSVRALFTTPDSLATQVTASLSRWAQQRGKTSRPRRLQPSRKEEKERRLRASEAAYRSYLASVHCNLVPFFSHAEGTLLNDVYVEIGTDLDVATDVSEEVGEYTRFDEPDGAPREADTYFSSTLRDLMSRPPTGVDSHRIALLGDPGAGKTTTARHLTWTLANDEAGPLPIYLTLPRLLRERRHPFEIAAEDTRAARGSAAAADLEEAFRRRAETSGSLWLFLDGLDEVAPEDRAAADERICAILKDLPLVATVVLSRPIGFRSPSNGFERARLRQLSEPRQRELLERWLGTRAAEIAWERLEGRPALRTISGNPLLLTLIASLALERPDLPATRARLFDEALELLLARGFGAEPKPVRDVRAARIVLGELALGLQSSPAEAWKRDELDEKLRELAGADAADVERWREFWPTRAEFLKDVAVNSGVLGPHDGPREPWRFLHRQLREQLAAEALVRRGRGELVNRLRALTEAELPRWAEVLGLACTLGHEPLAALKALHNMNAEAGRRIIPEVEGLHPRISLGILVSDAGWNEHNLLHLVRTWREAGHERKAITWYLLEVVPACKWNLNHLGILHWTMALEACTPEVGMFFSACERPIENAPAVSWVRIPGGRFSMGSQEEAEEAPPHDVLVPAFEMSATPITAAQYASFVKPGLRYEHRSSTDEPDVQQPAVSVTWWAAYLFCQWIGGRLPSEAEWEYACRAGTTTRYWSGNSEQDLERVGWFAGNSGIRIHPVGEKPANELGLRDMHGNVWEWCDDDWSYYIRSSSVHPNPYREVGSGFRVTRGGCFFYPAWRARSTARGRNSPLFRSGDLGFRASRTIVETGHGGVSSS